MEELVQELATRVNLKGAGLMNQIRARMPEATIDAILDAARLVQIHQLAELIRIHEFETVLDLIEHLCTLSLADEDLDALARILEENTGTWISEKCSHDLAVLLKNGQLRSTMNFILKLKTPVQEPTGCFTWACLRLGNRQRRSSPPSCSTRTSPDTGKSDTDR